MEYAKMRAIAEELDAWSERLEGSWSVEIGPSGPLLAMRWPSLRRHGLLRRIRDQLDQQVRATHPGCVCVNGPAIEYPAMGRMRRPDAIVMPEALLDEQGFAVDAAQVLAVVEVLPPNPHPGFAEKLDDYPAMGIAHYMIVDPRTGTVEVHSDPVKGRYAYTGPYIFGDSVPFGPWMVKTSGFRRYGRRD
ncbi:Uma2 family endonuclease [Streptomyces sp. NPDC046727]|uniref:Uma2 family endonuclease n=1 Tax=Streptomyces sp. NPDC046727 TaxID=3155373 RepID=UPI0033C90608